MSELTHKIHLRFGMYIYIYFYIYTILKLPKIPPSLIKFSPQPVRYPKELRLSTAAKMPRSVHKLQLNLDLEPRRRWEEFGFGHFSGKFPG